MVATLVIIMSSSRSSLFNLKLAELLLVAHANGVLHAVNDATTRATVGVSVLGATRLVRYFLGG